MSSAANTPASTPEELRARAGMHDQEAHDSFERCDTDGFVSQWAHGVMADLDRLKAKIGDNGGKWEFPALFDTDGILLPAREVETRYGWAWVMDTPEGAQWFNPSKARDTAKRVAANARKGFYVGRVKAPAYAKLAGGGQGLAGAASVTACVFPVPNPESSQIDIVDNGKGSNHGG